MKNWSLIIAVLLSLSVVLHAQTVADDINLILQADPVEAALPEPVLQPLDGEASLSEEAKPVADDAVSAETVDVAVTETERLGDIEAALAEETEVVADEPVSVDIRVAEEEEAEEAAEAGLVEHVFSSPTVDPLVVEGVVDADQEVRVSMAFDDAPLPDVIRAFREASNANIVSGWTNETTRLVTMRLDNVPWKQGLSSILRSYDLEVKEDPRGSNIYLITERIAQQIQRYTQTFELNHAKAEDVAALFTSVMMKDSFVKAFPSANAVVVKGTEEELLECEAILKALDKPSRQVYIEARFVRLSSSASKKLGMKWDTLSNFGASISGLRGGMQVSDTKLSTFDYTSTDATRSTRVSPSGARLESPYTVTKTTGTLFPEKYTGATISGLTTDDLTWKQVSGFGGVLSVTDFGLAMSAFEQMDGAQLFSNPKIIVQNETKAKVDMTTKEPNVEIDYQAATQTGQRDSISSKLAVIPGKTESWVGEAFFSYGISLEVTPRISPSGLITVEIIPSISQKIDTMLIGVDQGMAQYPVISVQRLDTTFTMGDGKTAVIGGLTETKEDSTESGIPLLRSIPWIGPRLFGWKSRQKEQYEIIVFVTVGVVDGNTIAEDVGMPKNAVLGRGLMDGTLKEPGDRTDEEMFNLEQKPARGYRIK